MRFQDDPTSKGLGFLSAVPPRLLPGKGFRSFPKFRVGSVTPMGQIEAGGPSQFRALRLPGVAIRGRANSYSRLYLKKQPQGRALAETGH